MCEQASEAREALLMHMRQQTKSSAASRQQKGDKEAMGSTFFRSFSRIMYLLDHTLGAPAASTTKTCMGASWRKANAAFHLAPAKGPLGGPPGRGDSMYLNR